MPRTMPCPHCATVLTISENHANVKCPSCSTVFPTQPAKPVNWIGWAGKVFLSLGFLGLAGAFFMDPTVQSGYERSYNIGLLSARQNVVIVSCFFITNGLICQLFRLSNRHTGG